VRKNLIIAVGLVVAALGVTTRLFLPPQSADRSGDGRVVVAQKVTAGGGDRAGARSASPKAERQPDGTALLDRVRQQQDLTRKASVVAARVAELTAILVQADGRDQSELESAASKRRGLLKELIALDPAAALHQRLTWSQRRALPSSVQTMLEEVIDAYGQLEVVAICGPERGGTTRFLNLPGRRFNAYLAGARSEIGSQQRMAPTGSQWMIW
jgi:hypothetical protein